MKQKVLNLLTATAMLAAPFASDAAVHYVKADGTGDGTSWANAAGDLQATIDAAQAGDEVWVASGTFKPSKLIKSTKKTSKAFFLKDGVSLYGGFAGTESSKDDRATTTATNLKIELCANPTIIDADDDVADTWTRTIEEGTSYRYTWVLASNQVTGTKGNSSHALYCSSEFTNTTIIDGFTLKGGNANVSNAKPHGGALYAIGNVQLQHCSVIENSAYFSAESMSDSNTYGGAVYLDAKGKGSVKDCYFQSTYSHSSYGNGVGGAVYVKNGTVSDCYFIDCVATDNGGAVYACGGSKVTDCFAEKCYASQGGAFYADASSSLDGCVALSCRGLLGAGFYTAGSATHCTAANGYADAPDFGSDLGGKAGGFYVKSGSLLGCQAINNYSFMGGGIFVESGKVVNCTVQKNVLRNGETNANIALNDGLDAASTVFNTIYADGVDNSNFVKPTSFAGNATKEIQLAELSDVSFELAEGSQFIDAGSLTEGFTEELDIIGNPRISGKSIDVGAFEYQSSSTEPNVVFTFAQSGKSVRLGLGSNDGSFSIDWGDGNLQECTKAAYYSGIPVGNVVKVYGDMALVQCPNQGISAIDITNAPNLANVLLGQNRLKSINVANQTQLRGLYLEQNEIAGSIDLSNCKSLRVLDIHENAVTGTIDCSAMQALSKVDCSDNNISALILPHHSTVYEIDCSNNPIESLDLAGLDGLDELSCHDCKLTSLDTKDLSSLKSLYANGNKIKAVDVSGLKAVETLNLAENEIESIDLSKCSTITGLYLYDNKLSELDITSNPKIQWMNVENNSLTALNTSAQSSLSLLYANNNEIASMDFSNNKRVMQLQLNNNKLAEIDVTMMSNLSQFRIEGNGISTIDLSKNPYLYWLNVAGNKLSNLDLSNNTYVQWVAAEGNNLTSLDLSKNTGVQGLSLQDNKMDAAAINSIISQLQDVSSVSVSDTNKDWCRQLNISYMPGTNNANIAAAQAKGWIVTADISDGVNDINATAADVISREYITLSGVSLGTELPEAGIYVVKTTYADGAVKYAKVAVK